MQEEAVREIRALSAGARCLLQHKLRNGLQSVLASIEEGELDDASKAVLDISGELRKMGL